MSISQLRAPLFTLLTIAGLGSRSGPAQPPPLLQGGYVGSLGPLQIKLHLVAAADGSLSGTLDSPNQGALGIPCANVKQEGQTLTFSVPAVHGSWAGSIADDGAALVGTWTQGSATPLTFTRDTFAAAAKPSAVDGFWLGPLQAGTQPLRIQISVKSDHAGEEFCTLDSLDQQAFAIPCTNVVYSGSDFSFDVPAVKGNWVGKLSGDGNALLGTWTQGDALPLNFQRQARPEVPPAPPPVTFDSAIAPTDAADMQDVLSRDLQKALKSGALASHTGAGVAIGVVRKGVRRVFAFGAAQPDSIFEIGSITKTFTGLILAQMAAQRTVRLDEPVRELLPAGTVAKPGGLEISLLDLVTQYSGLPRMPDNFKPANMNNPYVDYRAANLYEFLRQHGVQKPADAGFSYSNLGVGLLGQALASRAGTTYERLLEEKVIGPLGMKDTTISLTPDQQRRFVPGHTADHRPAPAWDLDALAGAGAIRSTAADMLTYLEAQLHPEKWASKSSTDANTGTLRQALEQSHELHGDAEPGMRIAFSWLHNTASGGYWHNGATGGYSAFAFFNPVEDYAAIVLLNTTISPQGSFADLLGQHIAQRLSGQPAVSL